ncbi:hypothetical protein T09_8734 [Trichinella sp. T9]|nr:hypothetical protein T09_8734 [Trichinella sp. T9]
MTSRVTPGIYWYLRRVPTLDCWQPVEPGAWMVHSRLYLNSVNSYLPSMPLWRASWCQQSIVYVRIKTLERTDKAAVLEVDINPDTIICDFETALIPAIRGYFPNTRVQGCYFHFCQAVHRKVGELGLKTRYRQHGETRGKIKMLLATVFLPVPHVNILAETVTQYYHDIELLMIYWETYLVKPFATLNTVISTVFRELCNDPAYLTAGNVHALRSVAVLLAGDELQYPF